MSCKKRRDDDFENEEIVRVELEGFPPKPEDRDGIIQLLKQSMPKDSNLPLGDLADFIIAQPFLGTVVKNEFDETDADDDDDDIVFSLTTVVSLCESVVSRSSIISKLRDFLKSFISRGNLSSTDARTLVKILMGEGPGKPGLLINERFVNLPPRVAAESVAALPQEILNLPEEDRPTHLFILTRVFKSPESNEEVYVQPEMEVVRKMALAVIETEVVNTAPDGDMETIIYVIMAINFSNLSEILDILASTQ